MNSSWLRASFPAAAFAVVAGAASAQSGFVKVGPEVSYDAGDRCGVPHWAVADLNGDGRPDFVLANTPWSSFTSTPVPAPFVMMWIAQPDGSYREQTSQMFSGPVPLAYGGGSPLVADFNGDGRPDIYLPDQGQDAGFASPIRLALSTPAGYVDASARFADIYPRRGSHVFADIDGNGTLDIFASGFGNPGTSIGLSNPNARSYLLINDGAANFTYTQSPLPRVVLSFAPETGARSKQIDATTWYIADERFGAQALVDVNRDGYPDLVLAGNPHQPNGQVFLNDGHGDFSKLPPIDLPPGVNGGNWSRIMTKNANGQWIGVGADIPGESTESNEIRAVDLNGDGYPDLIIQEHKCLRKPTLTCYYGGYLQILINQGGHGFVDETAARGSPGFDSPDAQNNYQMTLQVADVNGDGFPDLIATKLWPYEPHVYLNDGTGKFSRTTLPGLPLPATESFYIVVSGGFQQPTRIANVRFDWRYNTPTTGVNQCTLRVQTWERPAPISKAFDLNQHGLTGSWYEAATSGQGIEVEVFANPSSGTGSTFVSWFTYDTVIGGAERQRWYTAQGQVVTGQSNAAMTIYRNTGGNFNAPPVTAAQVVGTATLSFDTCSSGQLAYAFTDGTGRTGTIPLTRLTQNVTCSTTTPYPTHADFALSGNWYDPATSGQGFTIEVNPNSGALFAAWYTYLPNGTGSGAAGQRWYTAQAASTPGLRSMPVTIYETTGGVFDTPTRPGQKTVPVGTGTMAFQSCSAATFSYNFTGGSSSGLSGTINLSRVGPVPPGCTT